jgi:pyruvate kinase
MPFLPLAAPASARATQLIATIGPSSVARVAELAAAGATAFRLNASHLDELQLAASLAHVREACPAAPIVVDLQGAKMRIDVATPRDVARGERCHFGVASTSDIPVPHPELFGQAKPGDTLSLDDGRYEFEVIRTGPLELEARALRAGRLEPRKGINIVQHPVSLTELSARDRQAARIAAARQASGFAFSFMTDGREAAWLRRAAPGCAVVGKIERREAVDRLEEIAARVDAIWICRGDLGVQLGPAGLARFVAGLGAPRLGVPVLMAGQVLEHLTAHAEPTRSEVCHLFDVIARGFAGIVLSDETAIGRDPVHAVSTASALLDAFRA